MFLNYYLIFLGNLNQVVVSHFLVNPLNYPGSMVVSGSLNRW